MMNSKTSPLPLSNAPIPRVQIAISIYKQKDEHVKRCISSALSQTLLEKRIDVRIDGKDGCSPKLRKWLKGISQKRPDFRLYQGEERLGIYNSYNRLFRYSRSRYLCQLDADDFLDPYALEILVEELDSRPDCVLAFSQCVEIFESGKPFKIRHCSQRPEASKDLLTEFFAFHLRMIKRSAFVKVGMYSQAFELAADYDAVLKLSEIGEMAQINLPLYYHRNHADSASTVHADAINHESIQAVRSAIERRGLSNDLQATIDMNTGNITVTRKHDSPCGLFYIVPEQFH